MTQVIAQLNQRGLRALIARSSKLVRVANDFRPPAPEVLLALQSDVDERFENAPPIESGGRVVGGQTWKGVTPQYLRRNPRRVGGRLLRDTGELAQSFQVGSSDNITQVGEDRIRFGSNLPKARGLANDRPLIFFHDTLRREIENIIRITWESTQ